MKLVEFLFYFSNFIVPTIEIGQNFVFVSVLVFFVFHAKLGTTNNDRTLLSDISY